MQALAQSGDDSAAAQVLFDEARASAKARDYASACPKFAESHRLDPQLGTLLNLADCYAQTGRVASAWAKFVEAAEISASREDPREGEARRRAKELDGKLVRLELVVSEPVEGMVVRRGDEEMAQPLWGTAVPVDPGRYTVVAEAEGHRSWQKEVDLTEEGATVRIEVPPLLPAPKEDAPKATTEGDGGTPLLVSGVIALGLGVAGLGVGTAFMVIAKNQDDDSLAFCEPNDPTLCRAEGVALREDAIRSQTIAIAGFVAGGVLAATGISLLVASSLVGDVGDDAAFAPWFGPQGGGVVGRLRF